MTPDLEALRQLAEALARTGRYAEAIVEAEQILAQAPADGPTLRALAGWLYEVGRYAEALVRYEAAVSADVALADAALKERIQAALADPRARIRLVAAGPQTPPAPVEETRDEGRVTFADVGGLDEAKEKIRLRVLHPLKRPELYQAFGKKAGGGVLFYGPPGCGKTYLARATAGEAGIAFFAVGIDEVLDMWLGQSEKRLHERFAEARRRAPAILFFDEVDALGGRRASLRHESYRTLVTQFLSELDGVAGRPEGVLVLGATNAPWDVDAAFRRPGRFGDVVFVPPPELRARVEILRLALRGRPVGEIDLAEIARATELYSGADLHAVVDAAVERALADSLRSGSVRPLQTADLVEAARRVRPSTREWFAQARNFAQYANEGGQYDEVVAYLKRHHLWC